MGIFSKIKDAIFGQKAEAQEIPRSTTTGQGAGWGRGGHQTAEEVDVEAVLEDRYSRVDQDLNWRSSIVDLMKLLDLDPSYDNRKELAQEMGNTDYSGSAEDNIWLHKRVMEELEKSGGRVPASLKNYPGKPNSSLRA